MAPRRTALVVGASAGVGRALAHALGQVGYDLVLAARDQRDLEAVASDVQVRCGVKVVATELDLLAGNDEIRAWFDRCNSLLGPIDAVLMPAGIVDDDDNGTAGWQTMDAIVETNFVSVAKIAGAFIVEFEARNAGTIVLFSSIAASAPRSKNVAYAAAKSALESYARSMQHRLAATDVRLQVYALGYVDTNMTRGRRVLLPVARPDRVAEHIVRNLDRTRPFGYLPRAWAVVAVVLRNLPWSIYRRLNF